MIRCWTWAEAPECLKRLSQHGGDEDFVFEVPADRPVPWWIAEGRFGFPCVHQHALDDGRTIVITAHA